MTNIDLIKSWGFIEKDGWLCNPKLDNEAIFQINEVNNKTIPYLIDCISATAFNAGTRWQREENKNTIEKQLDDAVFKLKKSFGISPKK